MAVGVGLTLLLGVIGVVTSQLVLLRAQANQAEAYVRQRAAAVEEVGRALSRGQLTAELAGQIGVATNATPEIVVAAIITKEGALALGRITERFRPVRPVVGGVIGGGEPVRINPILARRYGLFVQPIPTSGDQPQPGIQTNSSRLKMDSEMMKRYGLKPTAPKP